MTPAAQIGRERFLEAGCAGCHGGPEYTDSPSRQLHEVGTLTAASGHRLGGELPGFDTPSLRGLWLTAPYLHDGSAATLTDVLTTRNPFGQHGDLTALLAADPQSRRGDRRLSAPDRRPRDRGCRYPRPRSNWYCPRQIPAYPPGIRLELAANTAPVLGDVMRVDFYAGDALIGSDARLLYTLYMGRRAARSLCVDRPPRLCATAAGLPRP